MEQTNRCVAVLDVLGFKGLISDGNIVHLAQKLYNLVEFIPKIAMKFNMIKSSSDEDDHRSVTAQINKLLFSDTILLWSNPISESPEYKYFEVGGFLQGVAYVLYCSLLQGLPLRAGVAYGQVVIDRERGIALGKPIVDAHLTETAQEWIGGAIHDSCPHGMFGFDQEYRVPVKRRAGIQLKRAINWTMHAREYLNISGTREGINPDVIETLQRGLSSTLNSKVKIKYNNTLKYVLEIHDTLSNVPWV